ncbi:hypothetical protein [Sphingomonas glacialis]|uniref:hypothetical protein n=1 Tax=Sphingomonas glacialis TaxID=658225 RepID=UPI0013A55CAC|nr:hypothetical protein [Sphingomonas glacialis]
MEDAIATFKGERHDDSVKKGAPSFPTGGSGVAATGAPAAAVADRLGEHTMPAPLDAQRRGDALSLNDQGETDERQDERDNAQPGVRAIAVGDPCGNRYDDKRDTKAAPRKITVRHAGRRTPHW